jgi:hypothetical protein
MVCRKQDIFKKIGPFSVIEGGFFRREKWEESKK